MFTVFKMASGFGRSADACSVRGALYAQTFLLCKKVTAAIAHARRGCAGHSPALRKYTCSTTKGKRIKKNASAIIRRLKNTIEVC